MGKTAVNPVGGDLTNVRRGRGYLEVRERAPRRASSSSARATPSSGDCSRRTRWRSCAPRSAPSMTATRPTSREPRTRGHGDVPLRHAQPQRRGQRAVANPRLLEVIEPLLGEDCTSSPTPPGAIWPAIRDRTAAALAHRRGAARAPAGRRALAGGDPSSGVRHRRAHLLRTVSWRTGRPG